MKDFADLFIVKRYYRYPIKGIESYNFQQPTNQVVFHVSHKGNWKPEGGFVVFTEFGTQYPIKGIESANYSKILELMKECIPWRELKVIRVF